MHSTAPMPTGQQMWPECHHRAPPVGEGVSFSGSPQVSQSQALPSAMARSSPSRARRASMKPLQARSMVCGAVWVLGIWSTLDLGGSSLAPLALLGRSHIKGPPADVGVQSCSEGILPPLYSHPTIFLMASSVPSSRAHPPAHLRHRRGEISHLLWQQW